MFKHSLIVGAVALALGAGTASATTATFSVDAQGNGSGLFQVDGLDWLPNGAVVTPTGTGSVVSPNPEISNQCGGACPGVHTVVQTYAHARLGSFTLAGDPVGDLLNTQEWTFEVGFQEIVHEFSGSVGSATIVLRSLTTGDNFFRIWYNGTANADPLTGRGYGSEGGAVLVASGTVLPYNAASGRGETTFTTAGSTDTFDKNGANNYPDITSVVGQGSGTIDVRIDTANADFLPGFPTGSAMTLFLDTQLNAPFVQVNPSSCFRDGSGADVSAAGPISGGTVAQRAAACATNNLGTLNGATGPYFEVQSDASSSVEVNVPEPASLALAGIALTLAGSLRRRNRS